MPEFNPAEWIVDAQLDRFGQMKLTITETTAATHTTGQAVRFPPELTSRVVSALRTTYAFEALPGDPEPERSARFDVGPGYSTSEEGDTSLHYSQRLHGWTWGASYCAFPWEDPEIQHRLPLRRIH